jgi:hypothetical protein
MFKNSDPAGYNRNASIKSHDIMQSFGKASAVSSLQTIFGNSARPGVTPDPTANITLTDLMPSANVAVPVFDAKPLNTDLVVTIKPEAPVAQEQAVNKLESNQITADIQVKNVIMDKIRSIDPINGGAAINNILPGSSLVNALSYVDPTGVTMAYDTLNKAINYPINPKTNEVVAKALQSLRADYNPATGGGKPNPMGLDFSKAGTKSIIDFLRRPVQDDPKMKEIGKARANVKVLKDNKKRYDEKYHVEGDLEGKLAHAVAQGDQEMVHKITGNQNKAELAMAGVSTSRLSAVEVTLSSSFVPGVTTKTAISDVNLQASLSPEKRAILNNANEPLENGFKPFRASFQQNSMS